MIKLRRPYCLQNESILRFLQMLATASTLKCLETFDFRKKYRYRHAFTVCKVLGERDIFGKLLPHGCPNVIFIKRWSPINNLLYSIFVNSFLLISSINCPKFMVI